MLAASALSGCPSPEVEIAGPLGPNQAAYTVTFHSGERTIFLPELSFPEMVLHEYAHHLTDLFQPQEATDDHGPYFVRYLIDLCNAFGVCERWVAEKLAEAHGLEIALEVSTVPYEGALYLLEHV